MVAVVQVNREREVNGVNTSTTHYYITSLKGSAKEMGRLIRRHWAIENELHWVLDVAFREDECRVRKDHSARNLAMIRRAVLNMLRREPSKTALKRKRLKALINPAYRQAVLAG